MPQILVVTDDRKESSEDNVVYRERIAPSDFESQHFSNQLAERVGWAVDDARRMESSEPSAGLGRGR
jgi:hypothetical protein